MVTWSTEALLLSGHLPQRFQPGLDKLVLSLENEIGPGINTLVFSGVKFWIRLIKVPELRLLVEVWPNEFRVLDLTWEGVPR